MKTTSDIYCSFLIGQSEFALAVSNVQEVVNPPKAYTRIPLGPDYLMGMFNLRGTVIPVVDLHAILKIERNKDIVPEANKIAIVECGHVLIGLIFDGTGEVFRSRGEDKSDFTYVEGQSHVISGAFKLNDGQRIIQIIDPKALFNLEHIPHHDAHENSHAKLKRHRGLRKQCISFHIGPASCAVGIDSIQEILKLEKVNTSMMTSANHCLGTIDLRGNVVPVVDFASLLGYREPDRKLVATDENRRVLVMRMEEEFFGLMVDSIESIVSYFAEELLPFPVLGDEKRKMFTGCISREGFEDIILLERSEILSNAEIHEITRGHSKIYKASDRRAQNTVEKGMAKTYITFHLENLYAVHIGEVREIIDLPEKLLHPPGLPNYFQGVLNLRGVLVTIIDTRAMYGLAKPSEPTHKRVLIFESKGGKFGLVVDGVDAILSISESNKMNIPEILYKSAAGAMGADVKEAVEVKLDAENRKTLMILNMESISSRIGQVKAA